MKKVIIVFFILTLLSLNSTWADENEYHHVQLYDSTPENYYVLVYDTHVDSDNATTVEQTDSAQENDLPENTTTQNNNVAMENNAQSINSTQSTNNTQPISNTQSTNNISNDVSVATPMQNTANPLIVMLLACILIPMGIYRKRK